MITKARDPKVWKKARYYDLKEKWSKVSKFFRSEEARNIWHPCIEEFMERRAEESGFPHTPKPDARFPTEYESCDWRSSATGRQPAFWDYARHSACHWVADLALFVAKKVHPEVPWRLLYSQKHTTVPNGSVQDPVLFDINFQAMGVTASQALEIASKGREFKPGVYLKPYLHRK
jgi:hypothetical protein